jgi:single-strand DNA-binding protein
LQTRKWQDKEGNDKYSTEVVLQGYNSSLTMLDGRGGGGGGDSDMPEEFGSQGASSQRKPAMAGGGGRRADMDDEIPF